MVRPYRVICEDSDPEWITHRHRFLTGTGVSAMLGENPWTTAEGYLASKIPNEDGEYPAFRANRPMLNGSYDEEYNATKFAHIAGLRRRPCHLFLASTRWPELACTLDGLVRMPRLGRIPKVNSALVSELWPERLRLDLGEARSDGLSETGLLEMKQTELSSGRRYWLKKARPPYHYEIQLQSQLHVTGYDWGILAARVGAHDMQAFFVRRDDRPEFTEGLDEICKRFREVVLDF